MKKEQYYRQLKDYATPNADTIQRITEKIKAVSIYNNDEILSFWISQLIIYLGVTPLINTLHYISSHSPKILKETFDQLDSPKNNPDYLISPEDVFDFLRKLDEDDCEDIIKISGGVNKFELVKAIKDGNREKFVSYAKNDDTLLLFCAFMAKIDREAESKNDSFELLDIDKYGCINELIELSKRIEKLSSDPSSRSSFDYSMNTILEKVIPLQSKEERKEMLFVLYKSDKDFLDREEYDFKSETDYINEQFPYDHLFASNFCTSYKDGYNFVRFPSLDNILRPLETHLCSYLILLSHNNLTIKERNIIESILSQDIIKDWYLILLKVVKPEIQFTFKAGNEPLYWDKIDSLEIEDIEKKGEENLASFTGITINLSSNTTDTPAVERDVADPKEFNTNFYDSIDENGKAYCMVCKNGYSLEKRTSFSIDENDWNLLPLGERREEYFQEVHKEILQDPTKLQELIGNLYTFGKIGPSLICKYTLLYRITGKYRPEILLDKIKWIDSNPEDGRDLLYLIQNLAGDRKKYKDMKEFFEGPAFSKKPASAAQLAERDNSEYVKFLQEAYPQYYDPQERSKWKTEKNNKKIMRK